MKYCISTMFIVTTVFALSGMLTGGLLQADVTAYEHDFGLNHEETAWWMSLFTVLTALGGTSAGWLSDRLGAVRVFRIAVTFSGLGLLAFVTPFTPAAIAGFILAGLGIGALVIGNVLASETRTGGANHALNTLHGYHGLARLAAVPLSILALSFDYKASYLILGLVLTGLAVIPLESSKTTTNGEQNSVWTASMLKLLAPILAGFFVYMIAEMVMVTWLAAYFEKDLAWSPRSARSAYGIFLLGLIAGRFAAAAIWPDRMPRRIAGIIGLVHAAALSAFMATTDRTTLAASLLIVGCCQGPGWPALFAWLIDRVKGAEGRVTSVVYLVVCIGIIVATAGSGMIGQRFGLASVFSIVLVAHLIFSALFVAVCRPQGQGTAP